MNKVVYALLTVLLVQTDLTNFDKFNNFLKEGKLNEAKVVIDNWGEQKEKDPQYYISCFNYYINKSMTQGYAIQSNPPTDERMITLILKDPTTGNIKGYMVKKVVYDTSTADTGINYIKTGIKIFPDHYEMRFGLLWALKELDKYDDYIVELEDSLKYFKDQKLTSIYWNDNKKIDDPYRFIIEILQEMLNEFIENDEIYSNKEFLNKFVDMMIKYFPSHKYGYANKGFLYFEKGEFDKALEYYMKAYEIDNKDLLVMFNIGLSYKRLGKHGDAISYFEKIIKIGGNTYFVDKAKNELNDFQIQKH